jgi:hypothetical protein
MTAVAFAVSVALISWLGLATEQISGQQPGAAPQQAGQPGAQLATAARHVPFDVQQRAGEHPLKPLIRVAQESLQFIDQNVRDYACILQKTERVDGELLDPQAIELRVLHEPFSVYLKFRQPFPGREVLYVAGKNEGNLTVLDSGWKRNLGKVNLDPEGMVAMKGQKHPITMIGMRNLLKELIRFSEADTAFGECEVETYPDAKIGDRDTTAFVITHPQPRQNFRFHKVRVFFDNELKVPIHFEAYLWPKAPGQKPPLEEMYTYHNLQLNTAIPAEFFDPNNPQIFQ